MRPAYSVRLGRLPPRSALGPSPAPRAAERPSSAEPPPPRTPPWSCSRRRTSRPRRCRQISSGPVISGQLTPAREAIGARAGRRVDRGPDRRSRAVVSGPAPKWRASRRATSTASKSSAEAARAVGRDRARRWRGARPQRTEALVKGGALAARDLEQAKNACLDGRGPGGGGAARGAVGRSSSSTTRR